MTIFRTTDPTVSMVSNRLQLRQATHEYHARLNRHPFLKGLAKPVYPLADYQTLLLAYSLLYRSIEAVIRLFLQSSNVDFDYSEREKLPGLIKSELVQSLKALIGWSAYFSGLIQLSRYDSRYGRLFLLWLW